MGNWTTPVHKDEHRSLGDRTAMRTVIIANERAEFIRGYENGDDNKGERMGYEDKASREVWEEICSLEEIKKACEQSDRYEGGSTYHQRQ